MRTTPLKLAAAATTLAVGLGLGLVGTASADTSTAAQPSATADSAEAPASLSGCPGAALCLWRDSGFSGTQWTWRYGSHPHNQWLYVGSGANDQASSIYNNRGEVSGVAKNFPATSPDAYCEPTHSVVRNLAGINWPDGTPENDSISSVDLFTATAC